MLPAGYRKWIGHWRQKNSFMKKQQTPEEIVADLKSRGERNIRFEDNGIIISCHGKMTVNYWILNEKNELICIDCKTIMQ